ncbi:MAG TPA: hypothetical protein DCY79_01655, partial [Planctomycetaceae bacterium]|nr:hypothetical protein [Planctomycetaceae bacterium]
MILFKNSQRLVATVALFGVLVSDANGVGGLDVSSRAFFKAHCLRCHDSEKQKGKFRLDNLSNDFTNPLVAEKW